MKRMRTIFRIIMIFCISKFIIRITRTRRPVHVYENQKIYLYNDL